MKEFRRRFPGYDVLDKRSSPSWNAQTRKPVEKRISEVPERRFFNPHEWDTLTAVCARVIPQPDRAVSPVPIAPFIDRKMAQDQKDGYRYASMPSMQEAWRRGLKALDGESRIRFESDFIDLPPQNQDEILKSVQEGKVKSPFWRGLPPQEFFKSRILHDTVSVYYAHPAAWNEIGFGGPASPRGYLRLGANRRDPWEAAEVENE